MSVSSLWGLLLCSKHRRLSADLLSMVSWTLVW